MILMLSSPSLFLLLLLIIQHDQQHQSFVNSLTYSSRNPFRSISIRSNIHHHQYRQRISVSVVQQQQKHQQQPLSLPRQWRRSSSGSRTERRSDAVILYSTNIRGGGGGDGDDSVVVTEIINSNSNNNDNDNDNDSNNNNNKDKVALVQEQIQLFIQIAKPYFMESSQARFLLISVIGLTLANSGISVLFSYLSKDFWNTLSSKQITEFYIVLQKYIVALCIGAPIITYTTYQREQFTIHWRDWMTTRTIQLYLQDNNQIYYKLERNIGTSLATTDSTNDNNTSSPSLSSSTTTMTIDNPDQRITDDINTFTSYSISFMLTIITSIIDLFSFTAILWNIYPQLFIAIVAYAGLGTLIAILLGQPLIGLNFQQLRKEADLRYLLVRLRDNCESIAFYNGETIEQNAIQNKLQSVVQNKQQMNKAQRNLEYFTTAYRYIVQILPIAVVAPKYFAGNIEIGTISQSVGAFNHILNDVSIIINRFESLSSFSAGLERLTSFYTAIQSVTYDSLSNQNITYTSSSLLDLPPLSVNDVTATAVTTITDIIPNDITSKKYHTNEIQLQTFMDTTIWDQDSIINGSIEEQQPQQELHQTTSRSNNNVVLEIKDVTVITPDYKRTLIQNLNLQLQYGEHLLIVGNSGCGKSSLLRVIAGLWTSGSGMIQRPINEQVYFLPQRPYCTIGNLKDQLLYPSTVYNTTATTTLNETTSTRLTSQHSLKYNLTDQELLDILEKVELLDVAKRFGDGNPYIGLYKVYDWSNILSLGEQQRLAFGRVLVNRPTLVIVDEATSALDIRSEAKMYQLLQDMSRISVSSKRNDNSIDQQQQSKSTATTVSKPGMTYISVGHRPSLMIFHNKKLHLGTSNSVAGIDSNNIANYEITNIEKSAFELPATTKQLY